jgi:hypothetical protein
VKGESETLAKMFNEDVFYVSVLRVSGLGLALTVGGYSDGPVLSVSVSVSVFGRRQKSMEQFSSDP